MEYFRQLCEILRKPPLMKEPLARHTSLGIGGPADYLVDPHDTEELRHVLLFAREHHIPTLVLGHGTNLLVLDEGYRGIAISLISACSHCNFFDHRVQAGANVALPRLANEIARRGLTGMEFAAGIPGTLGGALYMNAGAFGYYTADLVETVTTMDQEGCLRTRLRSELNFAYRWSSFQDENVIILEATLALKPGDPKKIAEMQEQMLDKRATRHPRQPSAGSVFRNPPEKSAGYLIEQAGLKGISVGGAQISPMHGNFIVNNGNATASHILKLINIVKESVREKFGIELQLEIRVVGGNWEIGEK